MPHVGRGSHTGGVGRREAGGGVVENLGAGIEDRRDWIRSLGCASHSPASFLETALKEKAAYLEAEMKQAPVPRPQSAKAIAIREQQEQLGVILEVFRDTGKLAVYRDALRRGYSKEAAGRAALRCGFKGPLDPKLVREPNLYGLRTALTPMVRAEQYRPGPLPRGRIPYDGPRDRLLYPKPRAQSAGRSRKAPWDGSASWASHVGDLSQGKLVLAGYGD
jgi:hypothetical protein